MNENQFAENLMYYRKKKGLSQEKVAEYLEVSRQAVTKWEANASRPNSDNLMKLAQLFEVEADTLLGNGDREESPIQEEVSMGKMPSGFDGNIGLMYSGLYHSHCIYGYFQHWDIPLYVCDLYPNPVIPAYVSFQCSQKQFLQWDCRI